METKKDFFSPGRLRSFTGNVPFRWEYLKARGSAGGILVGANSELFTMSNVITLKFSVSVVLTNKVSSFAFKWITVYGSAYDNGKQEFLDELEMIMESWNGPIMIGGDFNLVRSTDDKSNGIVNHKWVDLFNEWINRWALIELDPTNRKYTWTSGQDVPILARIDRVFVSTAWDAVFPLTRIKALERPPSDHNPLLVDSGDSTFLEKRGLGLRSGGWRRKHLMKLWKRLGNSLVWHKKV